MKKQTFIFLLLIHIQVLHAQTLEEWTKQRRTQIKYLIEQIVALKDYGLLNRKGYRLIDNVLTQVQVIKGGDRSLHNDYFSSLEKISSSLKYFAKLLATIRFQQSIVNNCKKIKELLGTSDYFTQQEKNFCLSQIHGLLTAEVNYSKELSTLTSNKQLELKDDERFSRLGNLYQKLRNDHLYSENLLQQIYTLRLQRLSDKAEIKNLKDLQEIK